MWIDLSACSQTFKQYFENVCSDDLMNKMQLKQLGFLLYEITTQRTKQKPSCFDSNRFLSFDFKFEFFLSKKI